MYTRVLQVCVWFGGGKQLAAKLMPRKQPTFVLAKSGAKLPTTPREKSKLARWYCFLVIQHARCENNFHWKSSSNTDVFIMILVVAMFDCRRVHIANFFWFLLKGCWLYPCFASQSVSVGLTSWTFTSLSLQESNHIKPEQRPFFPFFRGSLLICSGNVRLLCLMRTLLRSHNIFMITMVYGQYGSHSTYGIIFQTCKKNRVHWIQISNQAIRSDSIRYGDGSKPWYLVNPKIAGKWMFIPLKNVSIGIDPYPYYDIPIIFYPLVTPPSSHSPTGPVESSCDLGGSLCVDRRLP